MTDSEGLIRHGLCKCGVAGWVKGEGKPEPVLLAEGWEAKNHLLA